MVLMAEGNLASSTISREVVPSRPMKTGSPVRGRSISTILSAGQTANSVPSFDRIVNPVSDTVMPTSSGCAVLPSKNLPWNS